MNEQIKKFLNEEQDPKAIEKITSKLSDLLMKNEEVKEVAVALSSKFWKAKAVAPSAEEL